MSVCGSVSVGVVSALSIRERNVFVSDHVFDLPLHRETEEDDEIHD